MPKAIFVDSQGQSQRIEVANGESLMRAAVNAGLNGIVGMCGGVLSCATCHVYVDRGYLARLPPPSAHEQEMLYCTSAPRRENSRLCCQIEMNPDLDGIVMEMADPQQ